MVLERFNVPDTTAILVPVESMRAVVHQLFLASGLDDDGACPAHIRAVTAADPLLS